MTFQYRAGIGGEIAEHVSNMVHNIAMIVIVMKFHNTVVIVSVIVFQWFTDCESQCCDDCDCEEIPEKSF